MNGKQLFFLTRTGWRNTQIGRKYGIRKGPKDGVKIKVYKASGLCKRTFHRGDSFQVSAHDWLASKYSFKVMYIMVSTFC